MRCESRGPGCQGGTELPASVKTRRAESSTMLVVPGKQCMLILWTSGKGSKDTSEGWDG